VGSINGGPLYGHMIGGGGGGTDASEQALVGSQAPVERLPMLGS
jgi:hypothetical protein